MCIYVVSEARTSLNDDDVRGNIRALAIVRGPERANFE